MQLHISPDDVTRLDNKFFAGPHVPAAHILADNAIGSGWSTNFLLACSPLLRWD